jgi:hypothetical protein
VTTATSPSRTQPTIAFMRSIPQTSTHSPRAEPAGPRPDNTIDRS